MKTITSGFMAGAMFLVANLALAPTACCATLAARTRSEPWLAPRLALNQASRNPTGLRSDHEEPGCGCDWQSD
jgi:hypothetical protein